MLQRITYFIALILYASSMFSPIWNDNNDNRFLGFYVLLIGWMGIFALDPRWLCNVAVIFATIVVLGNREKFFVIACYVCAFFAITTAIGPYYNSGDPMSKGQSMAFGGYLWISSIILFSMSAKFPRALRSLKGCILLFHKIKRFLVDLSQE